MASRSPQPADPTRALTPVASAVRTSARVALWSSLALTAATTLLLGRFSSPVPPPGYAQIRADQALFQGIDFTAFPEVQLLQQYVGIDTSLPDPHEARGAEWLAAQLAAAGIESTIERLGDGRANLWAFVEGEDPKALALAGHIDVEPAIETEGWAHPPFGGVVVGPWIYGRGMYDMKSLTVAQLLATIDVARSGRRPRRSLLFLQTAGEEEGSAVGTRWLMDAHPELFERIGSVLTEGGVVEAVGPSEIKYWGIEFGQKSFARIQFCARDRQALVRLRAQIVRTGKGYPYPDVRPEVRAFLAAYGPSRDDTWLARLATHPDLLPRDPDRFGGLSPFLQALFRDELFPFQVQREADGGFSLTVWFHLLPDSDLATVRSELLPDWQSFGIAASPIVELASGPASPLDHPDVVAIEDAVRERFPGVPVGPYFLPWAATDSRLFRARGIPSYGFSPFPVVVFDTLQIAKANERMQLPAFRAGIALYRETIRRLVE